MCKSRANKIVYKGLAFSELSKGGFINKKDDIYEKILNNKTGEEPEFREFFSVKCSNVAGTSIQTKLQW